VSHPHGHSHGRIDPSIRRSRAGLRAVEASLAVLGITALAQTLVFILTDSVALLADLIHNFGDALTALPIGIAFAIRSPKAEHYAGLAIVLAIFVSACVAGFDAAVIRTRAGLRLKSAALVADGNHARVDALVSLGVVGSAILVALGAERRSALERCGLGSTMRFVSAV
jgi:divalent metal cation (Fe/Co/Zn/Cd) transporter